MVEELPQWSDAPPQKPKPAVVVERCGVDWELGTGLNTCQPLSQLSIFLLCVHSGVMLDVQNCNSNNITQVGQPQRRDVTKAAPLHWFETVGPGGH